MTTETGERLLELLAVASAGPVARRGRAHRVDRLALARPRDRGPPFRLAPESRRPQVRTGVDEADKAASLTPVGGLGTRGSWSCGGPRWRIDGSWSRRCARIRDRRSSLSPTGRGRIRSRVPAAAGHEVAFLHSDESDAGAHRGLGPSFSGNLRRSRRPVGRARPRSRPRRRDRGRRRRRGVAGGAIAHVARARGAGRTGGAPGSVVLGVSPAPTVEAIVVPGGPARSTPRARRRGAWLAADARDRPARGAAGRRAPHRGARRPRCVRRTGRRVRAQPAGPVPPAACARASTCCAGTAPPNGRWYAMSAAPSELRVLRVGRARACGRSSRRSCRAPAVADVDAANRGGPVRPTSSIGTEAVLHRSEWAAAPRCGRVPRSRPGAARAALPRRPQAFWLLTRGAQLLAGGPAARR